jgi:hypothetical protein
MVGFGSAYRMSRRRGWESAYFDYETLKLLLTQIEAVYEESTGLVSGDGHFSYPGLSGFEPEDIFDARYDKFDERLTPSGAAVRRQERKKERRKTRQEKDESKHMDWRDELFLESDSSAAYASSDDESEDGEDDDYIQEDDNRRSLEDVNFSFSYGNSAVVPSYGSSESFVIGGGTSAASGTVSNDSRASLDNRKNRFTSGENQPILSYSHSQSERGDSIKSVHGTEKGSILAKKRKTHRRKLRFGRKRNIPPHLRTAHEKARAITGRFLGVLRAEIDKVSLFVHSRMGELTDTIGSLRFSSDTLDFDNEYMHQLSDGGIHPSSSSSSEDSSSSSADTSNDLNDIKNDFNIFPKRRGVVNRGGGIMTSSIMHQNLEYVCEQYSTKSTTLRQLSLAEHLRLTRPIFRSDQVLGEDFLLLSAVDEADAFTAVGVEFLHLLRFICVNSIAIRKLCKKHDRLLSNRMLGGYYHKLQEKAESEDLDLLDSPNDIKSTPKRRNTKIRKKSKRQIENDRRTYGMPPSRRLGSNMLLGTYDSQVQALANSLVAATLSENLEVALAEFEISRRRADRLSSIPIKRSNVASRESYHEMGESDNFCYGFPSPKTFGFASKKHRDSFREEVKQDDEKSDAQSTSSSISLARLRFIVSSVGSLRQAATEKRNVFSEYLARSLLVIEGHNFIGEPKGLNGGCCRETLEFFASYNPDLILILDPRLLQQKLTNQDHLSTHLYNTENTDLENVSERRKARKNSIHGNFTLIDSAFNSVAFNRIRQLNLALALYSTVS